MNAEAALELDLRNVQRFQELVQRPEGPELTASAARLLVPVMLHNRRHLARVADDNDLTARTQRQPGQQCFRQRKLTRFVKYQQIAKTIAEQIVPPAAFDHAVDAARRPSNDAGGVALNLIPVAGTPPAPLVGFFAKRTETRQRLRFRCKSQQRQGQQRRVEVASEQGWVTVTHGPEPILHCQHFPQQHVRRRMGFAGQHHADRQARH